MVSTISKLADLTGRLLIQVEILTSNLETLAAAVCALEGEVESIKAQLSNKDQ